jgi:hypothetical protein
LEEKNMKKLLSLLGAAGLIATSSATVVSCGDPADSGESEDYSKPITYTFDELFSAYKTEEPGTYFKDEVVYTKGFDDTIWRWGVQLLADSWIYDATNGQDSRINTTVFDFESQISPFDSSLEKIDNLNDKYNPNCNIVSGETYSITYKMDSDFVDEDTNATIKQTEFTISAKFVLSK